MVDIQNEIRRFQNIKNLLLTYHKKYSLIRIFLFFGGIISSCIIYFKNPDISLYLFITAVVLFLILSYYHNKIINKIHRIDVWNNLKEDIIAKEKLDWENIKYRNIENNFEHPFEFDLSVCGPKSLISLVDFCVTEEGTYHLRNILNDTNINYEKVVARQRIVNELKKNNHFCKKIVYLGKLSKLDKPRKINDFLKIENSSLKYKLLLFFLFPLSLINILLVILNYTIYPNSIWVYSLFAYSGIMLLNLKYISNLLEKAKIISDEVGAYADIFKLIEKLKLSKSSELNKIVEIFKKKKKPSAYLKKLELLSYAFIPQQNSFTALLFNLILPWDFLFGYKLEIYRNEIKELFPKWLEIYYEIEAYCSLGLFAFINKEYNFPEIVKEDQVYLARNIKHPLIKKEKNVSNDFIINAERNTGLITGSNMSGKSTFLKTIGINLVLAYSGAPVNAAKMRCSIYNIYTCINISDSVIDGISYFYAEVLRLKNMKTAIENSNNFFFILIDEIFKGTNNVERVKGSRSFIKYLTSQKTFSLITSHDLELAKLEVENKKIKNFHFEESIIENKMNFDYKLKEGPSPTTNALIIMKMSGLPVDE